MVIHCYLPIHEHGKKRVLHALRHVIDGDALVAQRMRNGDTEAVEVGRLHSDEQRTRRMVELDQTGTSGDSPVTDAEQNWNQQKT